MLKSWIALAGAGVLACACTSTGNVERNAAGGAAIGAIAGAVIGNNVGSGDAGTGAAIGAAIGGTAGAHEDGQSAPVGGHHLTESVVRDGVGRDPVAPDDIRTRREVRAKQLVGGVDEVDLHLSASWPATA